MGFLKDTFRAFWQTPEDKERLEQFVNNKREELQSQTAREIEQTQQSCAEILNQLQRQGEEELAQVASEQHARIEQKIRELENSGVMSLGAGDENLELLRKLLEEKSRL